MDFEQFQNSRVACNDLHERFPDDVLPGAKGWLYCGGQLWIEDTSTWSEEAPGYGQGQWYVRIGSAEHQSDVLEECEGPLYEFAKSEGWA